MNDPLLSTLSFSTVLAVQVLNTATASLDLWFPDMQAHGMGAFGDKSLHILSDYPTNVVTLSKKKKCNLVPRRA